MIDEFVDLFNNLIEDSKNKSKANAKPIKKMATWKHCVILVAAGWKAISFERVKEDFCDDAMITWRKEGKKDLEMRLPFNQQCLWIEYLERKNKETK